LLAADLRLGELMKKLNEMEGNISSLNRRIMLLEVSIGDFRARIFKLVRNPRVDSKESILPGCVAWRAGTITLFLLGS
jgi:hypothetical protein